MTVSLPEEKLNKIKEQTLSSSRKPQCSIRELAHVIGLIVSSFPVIKPARLYYRDLEVCNVMQLFICPSLPEIVYGGLLLTVIYITVLGFQNHQK